MTHHYQILNHRSKIIIASIIKTTIIKMSSVTTLDLFLLEDGDMKPQSSFYQQLLSNRKKRLNQLNRYRKRSFSTTIHPLNNVKNNVIKRRKKLNKDVSYDGIFMKMNPKETYWYKNYVLFPNVNCPHFRKTFRNRFRIPHVQFNSLLNRVSTSEYFLRWDNGNKIKSRMVRNPLSLLLLGTLRYLGRGWIFDDLEEATGIGRETHLQFFHQFIKFGSRDLYESYVKYPTTANEAITHAYEFKIAGMEGAIGAMDVCHIIIEKCEHRLKQNHLGGKSKLTCRAYNLTCNHRRQILHTTPGHPARWNDKTIVLYDALAKDLRRGSIMQDNNFELLERTRQNEIIKVKYRGAWLVVDNGYLNWGVTIPPMKSTMYIAETRWSEWIESMRKDVECTFGILKGRFRILKAGIRCHGVKIADEIWKTCCAMHNMLLEIDGITGEWDGVNGEFDFNPESERLPFALQRLNSVSEVRNYDSSGLGPGIALDDDDDNNVPEIVFDTVVDSININAINNVSNLSADFFQKKLIEHFDILFKQHKIKWTQRRI